MYSFKPLSRDAPCAARGPQNRQRVFDRPIDDLFDLVGHRRFRKMKVSGLRGAIAAPIT
jgi:hypothetical protein